MTSTRTRTPFGGIFYRDGPQSGLSIRFCLRPNESGGDAQVSLGPGRRRGPRLAIMAWWGHPLERGMIDPPLWPRETPIKSHPRGSTALPRRKFDQALRPTSPKNGPHLNTTGLPRSEPRKSATRNSLIDSRVVSRPRWSQRQTEGRFPGTNRWRRMTRTTTDPSQATEAQGGRRWLLSKT